MEKILKKTKTYQGKILDIKKVDIDFGNGQIDSFELIDFHVQTGVTLLPIDDQENVYLIKQYKVGVDKRILTLPSGGIEMGEDPVKVANKELQEEIGFKAGTLTLMCRSYTSPGYIATDASYIFLAKDLTPSKLKGDEVEEIQIIKLPFSKVEEMVRSGEIQDGKLILAILYYQQYYQNQ